MDIIGLAFRLVGRVKAFAQKTREFYYAVMLTGHECPQCRGRLAMVDDGQCRCTSCDHELDPTVAFQRCSECCGKLELRVRRYRCTKCGKDAASRFLFDGLALDAGYFRQKMAESRQRKREQKERVRKMLAECRSHDLAVPAAELSRIPGLVEALDGLVAGPLRPSNGNLRKAST